LEKYVDLHTHSNISDGSCSPEELVRHAKEVGLSAIAITDHDSIDGVTRAIEEGIKTNVEVIPGVEIGVDYTPEMHILGYFSKDNYKNIDAILLQTRKSRDERNPKMVNRLRELGFDITMEEVVKEAAGQIIARPHFAAVMVKKGYAGSIKEAFEKYLSPGKPGYVKKDKITPEKCIEEITKAGGIPVLAHPIHLKKSADELDMLVKDLIASGLKGIEVYYVDNTPDFTHETLEIAEKYNLLITGGSDFHGVFKPDIKLGTGRGNLNIRYELAEILKEHFRY